MNFKMTNGNVENCMHLSLHKLLIFLELLETEIKKLENKNPVSPPIILRYAQVAHASKTLLQS